MQKKRAIFLDRDGTLIKAIYEPGAKKEIRAPFSMNELEFIDGVSTVLEAFRNMGLLRILVTNQPDVAHGYLSEDEWEKIHYTVTGALALDDVFMCRHRSQDQCPLKKPSRLMILAACDKWGIDPKLSFMVGDIQSDMLAGKAAGCKTILIRKEYNQGTQADIVVPDLLGALEVMKTA